jgi:formylglycine-generating enzyme required for sulfatase activity
MAIRIYSPERAGRVIDSRLLKAGFREKTQLAQLVRPGNIAASFGMRGMADVTAPVVSRAVGIELPEMIALSEKLSIMKGEITVGLFKQVMQGYEITGHNADHLMAVLDDSSKAGEALTYLNLLDGREFAKRLSKQTGRKFRIQTEKEWLAAEGRLSGNNWTWTETKYDDNTFVLRRLVSGGRDCRNPGDRYCYGAVRLVEDLPVRQAGK